jgi:hypothetical protein
MFIKCLLKIKLQGPAGLVGTARTLLHRPGGRKHWNSSSPHLEVTHAGPALGVPFLMPVYWPRYGGGEGTPPIITQTDLAPCASFRGGAAKVQPSSGLQMNLEGGAAKWREEGEGRLEPTGSCLGRAGQGNQVGRLLVGLCHSSVTLN